jgi:hypothetical protein
MWSQVVHSEIVLDTRGASPQIFTFASLELGRVDAWIHYLSEGGSSTSNARIIQISIEALVFSFT